MILTIEQLTQLRDALINSGIEIAGLDGGGACGSVWLEIPIALPNATFDGPSALLVIGDNGYIQIHASDESFVNGDDPIVSFKIAESGDDAISFKAGVPNA